MEAVATRSLRVIRTPRSPPSVRHLQTLRSLKCLRDFRSIRSVPRCSRGLATATGGKVSITKEGLELAPEGVWGVKRWVLPSFWLRDNCRCVKCVNQDTRQRNFDTFELPADVAPVNAEADLEGIKVKWSHEGHESHYSWKFITNWLQHDVRKPEHVDFKYWGSEVKDKPPSVPFEEVMRIDSEDGIARLTSLVREYGFAFVDGTPYDDPERTKELLERIAFIRETHYGGFYDFIPDLAKADTAYTNLALGAHTDTTYFTDPAGLQAFHLLSHTPPPSAPKDAAAEGGESLLVDGFHAARILYEEDRAAYEILHSVKLPWHASGNQGITIAPDKRYPVLEVDDSTGDLHTLHRVRWNNDDRGVVPFDAGVSPTQWYEAARKWSSILKRKDVEYWVQLTPGRPLIFDNWRVLHGRSAFEGLRRICGGYVNRDDFISRWRNTNFPREQVLEQVIG